jgi:hypothetical protein
LFSSESIEVTAATSDSWGIVAAGQVLHIFLYSATLCSLIDLSNSIGN